MQLYSIVNGSGRLFSRYKPSVSCFKSLHGVHRRLIFARSINSNFSRVNQPDSPETSIARDETPSTTTSASTHWKLHLSVTSALENRTLSTKSPEWKALRAKILLRDNRTCSSCGYLSPYPRSRSMVVDHVDGVASNNDPSNLRILCPPCDSIRHCGFAGMQSWLTVAESTMEQVEIVRRTREIFEKTNVVPDPKHIDPSVKQVKIGVLDLANMMLRTPWKDLPEEFRRLRGFFTDYSTSRFRDTMLPRNPDTLEPTSFSVELHESSEVYLDSWLPSKTPDPQAAWICVHNPRSAKFEDKSPDLDALSSAWNKICAEGLSTLSELDKLAEQFNVLSGKWLVFVPASKVDNPWGQIVKSTLAGTLGNSAKVSLCNEEEPALKHVICVYNSDYRSIEDVNRVRDGLRQLGVKGRIGYKPDIYTHCGIHPGNSWGIPALLHYC